MIKPIINSTDLFLTIIGAAALIATVHAISIVNSSEASTHAIQHAVEFEKTTLVDNCEPARVIAQFSISGNTIELLLAKHAVCAR